MVFQNSLLDDMKSLSFQASKNIKEQYEKEIQTICVTRVEQSLESLLSDDCLNPVKTICVQIAIRLSMERIDQRV